VQQNGGQEEGQPPAPRSHLKSVVDVRAPIQPYYNKEKLIVHLFGSALFEMAD
jgi:hypothetical protein